MQQRNLCWIFKFRVHKSKVQELFHDSLLVKEQTIRGVKVPSLYNAKASVEFLQRTRGVQYVDSIWLNSELILTKTSCDRESLYQSNTINHTVLKSDMAEVSHRHWHVHYVVVSSHSLPRVLHLSDWCLTQFLSWDSDNITSFHFSKGKSLPYSNLWLGSTSNWMDSLHWEEV